MKIAIDQFEETVRATGDGPETEAMTGTTVVEVVNGIFDAGEMTPATGLGDEQMILLT